MKNFIKLLLCTGLAFVCSPVFSQNYNMQLRSTMTFPNQTLANICGYTQNGREYALIGGSKGMIIVDITNPDAPQQIIQLTPPEGNSNNQSLWKEIKVYQHYAYLVTEAGGGLQIVDLSPLPSADLPNHLYVGDGAIEGQLGRLHALHIDVTKGFLYIYGGGVNAGGAKVFNLNNDPYNPTFVGKYDKFAYVHDGYVDNDTLYAAHINIGLMSIVDMTDKSNPVVLGTVETPGNFTHNTWLLGDRKHLLTTDEEFPSFVTSYDISDPEDIKELDRVSTTSTGVNSIGHNTHVLNDWAITSWYTDGVTIVDAHRPDNLVEVGRYDNYATPVNLADPFDGCWGAYPYFPSGTIVTSNIDPAVFNVYTPTYVRACYLEGKVINGCSGFPLFGATITVNTPDDRVNTSTKLNGEYKTGQVTPGNYTVTISKPGFTSQTIPFTFATAQVASVNVTLLPANVTNLDVKILDAVTNQPIANAEVIIASAVQSFKSKTDGTGQYGVDCVANDNYTLTVGAWGYITKKVSFNGASSLTVTLERGYYDAFALDLGWNVSTTAISGEWEIGKPNGTFSNNGTIVNANTDASGDDNDQAYVTGNEPGGQSGDDVDNGSTVLNSPPMRLLGYSSGSVSFYYWFYNGGGDNNPNDKFDVNILIDGQSTPFFTQTSSQSTWRFSGDIPLPAAALQSNDVRIQYVISDDNPGHLLEAGLDIFKVDLGTFSGTNSPDANALITAAPNPSASDFQVQYNWEQAPELPVLEVRNLLGQVVLTENLNANAGVISCGSNWAPGVYLATLRSADRQGAPLKLVKQ